MDLHSFNKKIRRSTRGDIVLVILLCVAAFILFSAVDAFEWLHRLFEQNEDAELDELVPMTFVLLACLLWFSTRRWLEARRLSLYLTELSSRDALTGLLNRREINSQFARQMSYLSRYTQNFSVLMIDLDHFKRVNDQYGHLSGDQVLMEMAVLMEEVCRGTDIFGRWGGEEFIVGCPHTSHAQALELAERLRSRVASHQFQSVGKITISVGVTAFVSGDEPEGLLNRADIALYRAKEKGRNRVESITAGEQPGPKPVAEVGPPQASATHDAS